MTKVFRSLRPPNSADADQWFKMLKR